MELYGADTGKYRKKKHGNYNKRATKKQALAQKVNFTIFRLEGMRVSLRNMMAADYLPHVATDRLGEAVRHIRDALSVIRQTR